MVLGKKGDASDTLVLLIILFFLAVSFIVVIFVNTKLQEVVQTTELNSSVAAPSILRAFDRMNTTTVQRGFVMILALAIIFMMVSAFMVRVHPIFLFIYIFTLGITIFVAVFLANMYEALVNTPALAEIAAQQTMITWVMQHIVRVTLVAGVISMIVIFSKIFSAPVGGTQDI
jgi:hypothetical protein